MKVTPTTSLLFVITVILAGGVGYFVWRDVQNRAVEASKAEASRIAAEQAAAEQRRSAEALRISTEQAAAELKAKEVGSLEGLEMQIYRSTGGLVGIKMMGYGESSVAFLDARNECLALKRKYEEIVIRHKLEPLEKRGQIFPGRFLIPCQP